MKLTQAQNYLLRSLKNGKKLRRDMGFKGGYYLYDPESGWWSRKRVNINTVMALHKAKLLKLESTKFPFEDWGLTNSTTTGKLKEKE